MSAENKEKYAFFGLGAMGYPIAARLAGPVGQLIVSDIVSETVERLCASGNARPMTAECDAETVFLCLPNQDAVSVVLRSLPDGIVRTVVDFGAQSPEFVESAVAQCRAKGMTYCDAPVFGTPSMAAKGELYFLFSGSKADYDRFSDLFGKAGFRSRFAGTSGAASTVKLLQNALGTINLLAGAEALRICEHVGIDSEMFCRVVDECGGIGQSSVFAKFGRDMAARRDSNEGRLRIAAKDMAAAADLASKHTGTAVLVTETAKRFQQAYDEGMGGEQFSNIIKIL